MLRFEHIEFLWCLALLPVLILLFIRTSRWKRKALASLGSRAVIGKIMPEVSSSKPRLKFLLFLIAYVFLVIGLANPQIGTKLEEVKRKGADIMILLDVSNSMLAQDLAPNRLESAKMAISQLIDSMHDDRVGIVVFAGQAYVQLPMTTDYSAAKLFLNTINTSMVPTQGTAIGAAIAMGMRSLDFKDGMTKAMIVMTDGENHEDDAVAAASAARDNDVVIHVMGLGSPEGAPVPLLKNGQVSGFHTDSAGHTVVTKLNEDMCRQIASAGGGAYVRSANGSSGMNIIMDEIGKMQRKEYGTKSFKDFEDRFQVFLALSFLILLADLFVHLRKNRRLSNLKLFEVKKS